MRTVFCLFADDTGIFEPRDIFLEFIEERTAADGSDLGPFLMRLFQVLDTPPNRRQAKLDEDLVVRHVLIFGHGHGFTVRNR